MKATQLWDPLKAVIQGKLRSLSTTLKKKIRKRTNKCLNDATQESGNPKRSQTQIHQEIRKKI